MYVLVEKIEAFFTRKKLLAMIGMTNLKSYGIMLLDSCSHFINR